MPKMSKVINVEVAKTVKRGRPAGNKNKATEAAISDVENTASPHRNVTWECGQGCKIVQPANFYEVVCDVHHRYCTPIGNKVVKHKRTKKV